MLATSFSKERLNETFYGEMLDLLIKASSSQISRLMSD